MAAAAATNVSPDQFSPSTNENDTTCLAQDKAATADMRVAQRERKNRLVMDLFSRR